MHEWGEREYYLHQVPLEIEVPTFQEVSAITGTIEEPGEQFVALMGIAQRVSSYRQHAAIKDEDYSRYVLGDEDTRAMRSGDNWPDSAATSLQTLRGMKEERRWYKTLGNHVHNELSTRLHNIQTNNQQIRVEPLANHAIFTKIFDKYGILLGDTHDGKPVKGHAFAPGGLDYRDVLEHDQDGYPNGRLQFCSAEQNRFRKDRFFNHFAQIVDQKTGEPTAHIEFL